MTRRKKRSWEAEMRYEQQSYYDDHNTTQIKLKLNNKLTKTYWIGCTRRKDGTAIPLCRERSKS